MMLYKAHQINKSRLEIYSLRYIVIIYCNNIFIHEFYTKAKKASDTISPNLDQMPLEASYINSVVLNSLYGKLPAVTKHFTLKRKPKSAELRAMLIEKSNC